MVDIREGVALTEGEEVGEAEGGSTVGVSMGSSDLRSAGLGRVGELSIAFADDCINTELWTERDRWCLLSGCVNSSSAERFLGLGVSMGW